MDGAFREHGVVLQLGFLDCWSVLGDEDELGLSGTQALDGRAIAERVLARLHHERQSRVDVLSRLLLGLTHRVVVIAFFFRLRCLGWVGADATTANHTAAAVDVDAKLDQVEFQQMEIFYFFLSDSTVGNNALVTTLVIIAH